MRATGDCVTWFYFPFKIFHIRAYYIHFMYIQWVGVYCLFILSLNMNNMSFLNWFYRKYKLTKRKKWWKMKNLIRILLINKYIHFYIHEKSYQCQYLVTYIMGFCWQSYFRSFSSSNLLTETLDKYWTDVI